MHSLTGPKNLWDRFKFDKSRREMRFMLEIVNFELTKELYDTNLFLNAFTLILPIMTKFLSFDKNPNLLTMKMQLKSVGGP